MKIKVLFFAGLKDYFRDCLELETQDDIQVKELIEILKEKIPKASNLLERSKTAIDDSFVPQDTIIRGGESIAFIPPVSGGGI